MVDREGIDRLKSGILAWVKRDGPIVEKCLPALIGELRVVSAQERINLSEAVTELVREEKLELWIKDGREFWLPPTGNTPAY